ncbi:Thioesterase/thiol ester dehydrase-isomerase [Violaceomyces palustris]|uniref:Thioesterase/thiol ester dehydrase-isomerase n=1 Tax=Violaceomyces palustris TaxID=1673888 RepID=A0ACD0NRZ3_9BASI|nr:Thioesterase/thiol ester dehydrase-isomerase [Violaceomyces palustris]
MQDKVAASSTEFDQEQISKALSKIESMGYDPTSTWEQRVVWGDHDQFQHVNNVNYVKWYESSRMFFAKKIGEEMEAEKGEEMINGKGKSFILANISVRYRRPVTYPDTILIGVACLPLTAKDRFTLRAVAYSLKLEDVVSTSDQLCVTYDYKKVQKCEIPDYFLQPLQKRMLVNEKL